MKYVEEDGVVSIDTTQSGATTLATYSNLNANSTYVQKSFDLRLSRGNGPRPLLRDRG